MKVAILQRSLARIDRPTAQMGMTPEHRVRTLIPSGDPKAADSLLLLMEDWFPRGVFDRHPHRGTETVSYVIDARLDHFRRRSAGLSEVNMAGGTAPLRVLLYAGPALREPVVERGPFVMNTEEHIRQAYIDYRAGRFRLIGQ